MLRRNVIRIHHISDLHIPSDESQDSKHYVPYLNRLRDRKEKRPHFIVITGDLPLIGGADISAATDKFLKVIWDDDNLLLDIPPAQAPQEIKNILKSRTLFTRGNHDIDREELDKKGRHEAWAAFEKLVREVPSPYWSDYHTRKYLKAFGRDGVAAFAVPGTHVVFCCFDSTFRSGEIDEALEGYFNAADDHFRQLHKKYDDYLQMLKEAEKKPELLEELKNQWQTIGSKVTEICRTDPGFISPAALQQTANILQQLEHKIYPQKEIIPLRIALVHHNPCLWSPEDEKKRYPFFPNACQFLSVLRECGFHLLLCGHSHHRCLYFHYDCFLPSEDSNCKGLYVLGAPSLSSPFESSHGYNEIEVERIGPELVQLRIQPFEMGHSGFKQVRDLRIEFNLDLGASNFSDSIKCMKNEYQTMKWDQNSPWHNDIKSDFNELQKHAEYFTKAQQKMTRAISSGARIFLPKRKRWISGLETIGKVLTETLERAVSHHDERSTIEVFAVHAFGGEMWRRKELYNYLHTQIKYAGKKEPIKTKIRRIFLYEPDKLTESKPSELEKLRHLICALDEQSNAGIEVSGMPLSKYYDLLAQSLKNDKTQRFCREITSGDVISCDWVFFKWRQSGVKRWRLAVVDPALMEPEIVASCAEKDRIYGGLSYDIGMYLIDSEMSNGSLAQVPEAFRKIWEKLMKEASNHEFLENSALLKEFLECLGKDLQQEFNMEMVGRNTWITGVAKIEESKEILAVDTCYSAIDYSECEAQKGLHVRNIKNVIKQSDVWAEYLLRVWTFAHKTAIDKKQAKCQRFFVLSDFFLEDWDRLFERFKVLKEQFPGDRPSNSESTSVTLGLLLDTDLLWMQDSKNNLRKLNVSGTGNYLIANGANNGAFLWHFPGQDWSPQKLCDVNLYMRKQGEADQKEIQKFMAAYKAVRQLIVDLDPGVPQDELFGKRLARQPEELVSCLAHLHQVLVQRKVEPSNTYIEEYWRKLNNP